MIETYFAYMLSEYPADSEHGHLILQLAGNHTGQPMSTSGIRSTLRTLSNRANLSRPVNPHSFRHAFATAILQSGGDSLMARDAGGWSSAQTVEDIYSHIALDSTEFTTILERVWKTP